MNKKTVIVTGGSGYVGAQVSLLLSKKYEVIVIDKKIPGKLLNGLTFVKRDLLGSQGLQNIFDNSDYCIHLAAEVGGVAFANKYPFLILRNNARIDMNVIELARKAKLKRLVYISSSLVYEKSRVFPLKESDTENMPPPALSYGFEKLLGENLCKAYRQEHALFYSICRIFNVYGRNALGSIDPNGHVIPDLIKKVKKSNGEVELIGKKGIARNFSHVNDVAQGIVATLENPKAQDQTFNIADKKEYTLEEIVKILWQLYRKRGTPKFVYLPSYKKDVSRNFADVSRAKKVLGWSAKIKMEEGLMDMI